MFNKLVVRVRDVVEQEGPQRVVVELPGVVPARIYRKTGLGKGAIQPVLESLALGDKAHSVAPFVPICFSEVEPKISRPGRIADIPFGEGKDRGSGRLLTILGILGTLGVGIQFRRGGICSSGEGVLRSGRVHDNGRKLDTKRNSKGRTISAAGKGLVTEGLGFTRGSP